MQGVDQFFEFVVEEGEGCLEVYGVFGVVGLFDLGVDSVLVD